MIGSELSAPMSGALGATPASTSREPSAATMAPFVGAQPAAGHPQDDARRVAPLLGDGAQPGVGRHSPADDQVVDAVVAAGPHGLGGQHVDDRLLEARRDVGHRHGHPVALLGLDPTGDRGLQPGEREVVGGVARAAEPAREGDRPGSPARASRSIGGRREGQVEHARDLVEGLAGGVVDRGPSSCTSCDRSGTSRIELCRR